MLDEPSNNLLDEPIDQGGLSGGLDDLCGFAWGRKGLLPGRQWWTFLQQSVSWDQGEKCHQCILVLITVVSAMRPLRWGWSMITDHCSIQSLHHRQCDSTGTFCRDETTYTLVVIVESIDIVIVTANYAIYAVSLILPLSPRSCLELWAGALAVEELATLESTQRSLDISDIGAVDDNCDEKRI